jgi:cytosine/adenosine deaminase-related metal-dependent hydrolase
MTTILIRDGEIITMNPAREILSGSIYIEDGRIAEIPSNRESADQVIDAFGKLVLPGFVQVHVHLNQTLFRGMADDLDVVDWLRLRIWPLEQAHRPESVYASARLSIAEMIRGGTTTALTIETTNFTEAAFQAALEMGFRAVIGNAMMDRWEAGTEMIGDDTETSLTKSLDLLDRFHGTAGGRLGYALTPRGTRNASDALWKEIVRLANERNVLIHTHAAENRAQTERLAEFGGHEVHYLNEMGALSPRLVIAHAVWLTPEEHNLLAEAGVNVAHCPSANLKLASGLAPVPEMLSKGINVVIGADGAPCNNNLDAFMEMRLAALIHKPRYGPKAMPAQQVLEMMTLGGARALGLENEIGSLEAGKRADIIILNRDVLHAWPWLAASPVSQVVYEHQSRDVETVLVNGEPLLLEGRFLKWDYDEILRDSQEALRQLLERIPDFQL